MDVWKQIKGKSFDLIVVGGGGAGMSAALLAAKENLSVLLIEETEFVGGTTAYSAGTTWIPNTYFSPLVGGVDDSTEKVKRYLKKVIGSGYDEEMIDAFLTAGPLAIKDIQENTSVRYKARALHPDYHSEEEGATLYGRALEPEAFDARVLKERFSLVRSPIKEFTILGGLMIDRDDIKHLLNIKKSFASFKHAFKLISRYGIDRLNYKRGTKLVMGNALIASLLYSLDQLKVPILLKSTVEDLQIEGDVKQVEVILKGEKQVLKAKNILLATGGINRNQTHRKRLASDVLEDWCPGSTGNKGSIHDLLTKKMIQYGERKGPTDFFWAPVSIRQRADGSNAVFPHFILDRGKPHMITVNQEGNRFVNESTSYHNFGIEMLKQSELPVYLITDQQGIKQYGIGMVRPNSRDKDLVPFIREGYLFKGNTIEEIARQLSINQSSLVATIEEFNKNVEKGIDLHFKRGTTDYQKVNGDENYKPNPNLGKIVTGPFYAVALYPGDIGAATGIKVNRDAEVLNLQNVPIGGIYAVGNDMHSIMEGTYPGPGITLGPGLVFAWRAVKNILKDS